VCVYVCVCIDEGNLLVIRLSQQNEISPINKNGVFGTCQKKSGTILTMSVVMQSVRDI
jgi:hypothetical protein